jgi:hypothetical protein
MKVASLLVVFAIAGCAAVPPMLPPPPEVVKVPVYACPAPPIIDAPYEPVRDLVMTDAANPDKVLKSAGVTIGSLEATLDECKSALEVYRSAPADVH